MFFGFLRNQSGSISIYTAIFSAIAIGGGALAIDYGRIALMGSQMQSAADSAALAAVVQLDGKDGARARAQTIAFNAADNNTSLGKGSTNKDLSIASVKFYKTYDATSKLEATSDLEAKIIEVKLNTRTIGHMFQPVLNSLTGGTSPEQTQLATTAVAGTRPCVCDAPPLMMCDLAEFDPALDPTDPANVGRQIRLKEVGAGMWAPGNFGLLALPDGSSGAPDVEMALSQVTPPDCYKIDVITATGSKTNKVRDAINTRFDIGSYSSSYPPAPNVINFYRDFVMSDPSRFIGDGIWNNAQYWLDRHSGGIPGEIATATRWQTYLYELGLPYAKNGKLTIYPAPATLPAGYTLVTPPAANLAVDAANPTLPDYDGVPQNPPAPNGPARRLVKVALLQCIADGINGKGTYPTYGRYVEMFITEEVRVAPDAVIYGEIVRALTSVNSPSYYANTGLIK